MVQVCSFEHDMCYGYPRQAANTETPVSIESDDSHCEENEFSGDLVDQVLISGTYGEEYTESWKWLIRRKAKKFVKCRAVQAETEREASLDWKSLAIWEKLECSTESKRDSYDSPHSNIAFYVHDRENNFPQSCFTVDKFFSLSSKKIGRDKKNHTQSFKIKVYCSCRMPDHFGRKVIQCSVCWSLKNTSKDSDVVLNLYSKI